MFKLDFLVTIRFRRVIFDGFVAVLHRSTAAFCPGGSGTAWGWFFSFYFFSSMFLDNHFGISPTARWNKFQLRDDFCFSIFALFFVENHELYLWIHPRSDISWYLRIFVIFETPIAQTSWFFAKKCQKIEKQKSSRNWNLFHLAVGEIPNWLSKNIEEQK